MTTNNFPNDDFKKCQEQLEAQVNTNKLSTQNTCPNCGYCPTCGRGYHWNYPYEYYPYYPTFKVTAGTFIC